MKFFEIKTLEYPDESAKMLKIGNLVIFIRKAKDNGFYFITEDGHNIETLLALTCTKNAEFNIKLYNITLPTYQFNIGVLQRS